MADMGSISIAGTIVLHAGRLKAVATARIELE